MGNSYIEDDKLIRLVPIDLFSSTMRVVITKEEFLMCYKAWVEGKEKSNDGEN